MDNEESAERRESRICTRPPLFTDGLPAYDSPIEGSVHVYVRAERRSAVMLAGGGLGVVGTGAQI